MITINATGDTTLHTAGKYCPEDILVKVPAGSGDGSGGGGSVETCTVTFAWYNNYNLSYFNIHYTDDTGVVRTYTTESALFTGTLNCMKGTLLYMERCVAATDSAYISTSGDVTVLLISAPSILVTINGNGHIDNE